MLTTTIISIITLIIIKNKEKCFLKFPDEFTSCEFEPLRSWRAPRFPSDSPSCVNLFRERLPSRQKLSYVRGIGKNRANPKPFFLPRLLALSVVHRYYMRVPTEPSCIKNEINHRADYRSSTKNTRTNKKCRSPRGACPKAEAIEQEPENTPEYLLQKIFLRQSNSRHRII